MIPDKFFKEQIKELQNAFRSQYSPEHTKRLYGSISGYEEKHLKAAVDHIINTRQLKFGLPPNLDVTHAVRENWWHDCQKDKSVEKRQAHSFFHSSPKGTKLAKAAGRNIQLFLGEKITKEMYLARMEELGFKNEAAELKKWFAKQDQKRKMQPFFQRLAEEKRRQPQAAADKTEYAW